MLSDAGRFRFLSEFQLSIGWSDEGATMFWTGKARPGQPGRLFIVAKGRTLGDATDAAVKRWEAKHGKHWGAE
jgi:hypothetical protein